MTSDTISKSALTLEPAVVQWLASLQSSPLDEVRKLLAGTADMGRLRAAGPRDAVRALLTVFAPGTPYREALELGLTEWLDLIRKDAYGYSPSRKSFEAAEAFAIVGRLRLSEVISSVRSELDDWLEWAIAISQQQECDALADLYSALALTQRGFSDEPLSRNFALEPLWLDLCRGAGSRFPASYLSIGMLGLRSLPERVDAVNDQAWLRGLAVWAEEQEPSLDAFGYQWRAMCALYPRAKNHWKKQVAFTLRDAKVPLAIAEYWKHEIGLSAELEQSMPVDPARAVMSGPDQLAALLERLDAPLSQNEMHIRTDIASREHYAQVTGFSYYLTTTCCNIGMRLLETGPELERGARGRLAAELALKTLRWSPDDVYGWALWRDALEQQSMFEAAELVGWESIRRYPENPQWRSQLALLYVRNNQPEEAEEILLEARRRFPAEPAIVSILAELMLAKRDLNRAKIFADEGMAFDEPTNAAFSVSARLAYHTSGQKSALDLLDRAIRQHPTDPGLPSYRASIIEGLALPLHTHSFRAVAEGWLAKTSNASLSQIPKSTVRGGALRRIASKSLLPTADKVRAVEEVRAILAVAPNNEYARFIDSELAGDGDAGEPTFAEKLKTIIAEHDDQALNRLESFSPERSTLVEMVRAVIFKDLRSSANILVWLREGAQREARSVAAMRGFVTTRLAEGGVFSYADLTENLLIQTLAANDNFPVDLVEASLAPRRLLLAA